MKGRFKPGQLPPNFAPLGTLRVNPEGYLERKVTIHRHSPRDWQPVHRLVWEATHGPIPQGHVVVFKPSKRTANLSDITIDALELITRAELMRRNSYVRFPPILRQVIRLNAALQQKVRRMENDV